MKLIPQKEENIKPGNVALKVDGLVYIAKTPRSMPKLFEAVEKKHGKPPLVSFNPKGDVWFY